MFMRGLLGIAAVSVLFIQSCAEKSKVVYLGEEKELKLVEERCESDGEDLYCEKVYVKFVPVKEESLYEKERKEKLLKLIKSDVVPVRTPDEVIKVYVLPHEDTEGRFLSGYYMFMVVKDGKWILTGERKEVRREPKVLTPLEVKGDGSE